MMPAGIMNNSSKQVKKKGSDGVISSAVESHCHIHLIEALSQSKWQSVQYPNNENHRYFELTERKKQIHLECWKIHRFQ